jgi:hypothetical protein
MHRSPTAENQKKLADVECVSRIEQGQLGTALGNVLKDRAATPSPVDRQDAARIAVFKSHALVEPKLFSAFSAFSAQDRHGCNMQLAPKHFGVLAQGRTNQIIDGVALNFA